MGRAEVLQGVREMRFEGLLDRHERGELNQEEAAEMLGISERTFGRRRGRLQGEGPARRPLTGMMLHQDGSRHEWLQGQPALDLIVTLDDATSAIYSAFLVEEEGTASSFRGLAEVIARHGLFCELYTDRGSHYFHTPKAGEAVSKSVHTQAGRALAQLGIRHIAAPHLADPAEPAAAAFRARHRAGARIPRWPARSLPRPAPPGRLRRPRKPAR